MKKSVALMFAAVFAVQCLTAQVAEGIKLLHYEKNKSAKEQLLYTLVHIRIYVIIQYVRIKILSTYTCYDKQRPHKNLRSLLYRLYLPSTSSSTSSCLVVWSHLHSVDTYRVVVWLTNHPNKEVCV